jgi:hypothetical protein
MLTRMRGRGTRSTRSGPEKRSRLRIDATPRFCYKGWLTSPPYPMHNRLAMPFLCVLFASCATTQESGFITVSWQPANVGDAGIAARAYHDSGAYQRGLQVVADQAASWIKARTASAQRPALVLDIDETALSNWEIIQRDDFGRPIAGQQISLHPARGAGRSGINWDATPPSSQPWKYFVLPERQMSLSFSLPAGPNHSELLRSEICARLGWEIMRNFLWCPMMRISLLLPISRHRFAYT